MAYQVNTISKENFIRLLRTIRNGVVAVTIEDGDVTEFKVSRQTLEDADLKEWEEQNAKEAKLIYR